MNNIYLQMYSGGPLRRSLIHKLIIFKGIKKWSIRSKYYMYYTRKWHYDLRYSIRWE